MAKEPKIKVFRLSSTSYCLPERAILNPVTRWHCKYLPYPKQVDVSYKRLYCLQMVVQQIKWLLLQPFRVATVTTMVISTTLATTVTGGVLLRTIPTTPGTGTFTLLNNFKS
jgi:hypothetical protein